MINPSLSRFPLAGVGVVLLLVAVWVWVVPARADVAAPPAQVLHFVSGGREIQVDYYPPAHDLQRAPVVVLHGAGGMIFDGPDMRRMARRLAAADDPAYLVHYFDRTGSLAVTDAMMRRHFDEWLSTIRDAVAWVRRQPGNARQQVNVYGYSLGAFLSLAACSENKDVGALVEQAGGIWYGQRDRLRSLPPVLMVHGRNDQRVPFEKFAVPLQALLKARGVAVETQFYPGEGHRFTQPAEEHVRDEVIKYYDRQTLLLSR